MESYAPSNPIEARLPPLQIGFLIGRLDTGGAERQLSDLAIGMAARGHNVEIACYDGEGAFDQYVQDHGVIIRRLSGGSKFRKIRGIRKWIATFRPQILHGFMKRASSLAVLANLPRQRAAVVGSDFSTATYAPYKPDLWAALALFHLADRVVTETEMNKQSLGRLAPTLRGKITVVRNGVDDVHFSPIQGKKSEVFRFLSVGTVWEAKNPARVVEAVQILRSQTNLPFVFEWVGRYTQLSDGMPLPAYSDAIQLIEENGIQDCFSFTGVCDAVVDKYRNADALVHTSVQDGFPNVVVEGMACGLPIVVSRVSDLPSIVEKAHNGIVCDAFDPGDIARAMKKMLESEPSHRLAMGRRSSKFARDWFGMQRFITEYENMYWQIAKNRKHAEGRPNL